MHAAIDIGSNSVRLALSNGVRRSVITKLADGLTASGRLSQSGVRATLDALRSFAAECAACDSVLAFATEAVRRAADGEEFRAAVKRETGLDVRVLSPDEEATFALRGAVKPSGAVTVCDLGGGSMELISSSDGKTPEYVKSLPLGVVVLKNRYGGDYRAAIDTAPSLVADYGEIKPYPLVLIGGSACAVAAAILNLRVYDANAINGAHFTSNDLDDVMPLILSKKLATLRPVVKNRADTLPYGAMILQALINHVGATDFYVSDSSNLEAALEIMNSELGMRN